MSRVQCDTCKKLFANKTTLKNHSKICKVHDSSNEEHICDYCKKGYKSFYYLKVHMEKCKDLFEYKNNDVVEIHSCQYCNKDFQTVYTLNYHMKNCNSKITNLCDTCNSIKRNDCTVCKDKYINELLHKITVLETEKTALETSRNDLREQYNILLEKISKPNNIVYNSTTNNKITLKQVVSKLEPISYDLSGSLVHFTEKFIDEGIKGFAKFMVEYVCNDKIVTSDFSRNTIAYRTNFENFIRDPECISLINNTLKKNSIEIISKVEERKKHYRDLMDANVDNFEDCFIKATNIHELKKLTLASNTDMNIKDISNLLCEHGVKTYNKHVENLTQQN